MCHSKWRGGAAHPAFNFFYGHGQHHPHDERSGCDMPRHAHHHGEDDAGGFGVRRPLRFLAHKLDLDDRQVAAVVRILDELKTERAQAMVDDRRSLAEFADAVGGEAFDEGKATSGGERRVQTAAKLREAVVKGLRELHGVLRGDQRERLAYLLRTGILSV